MDAKRNSSFAAKIKNEVRNKDTRDWYLFHTSLKVTFSSLKVTFSPLKTMFSALKTTFRNVKVVFSWLHVGLRICV